MEANIHANAAMSFGRTSLFSAFVGVSDDDACEKSALPRSEAVIRSDSQQVSGVGVEPDPPQASSSELPVAEAGAISDDTGCSDGSGDDHQPVIRRRRGR